MNVARALFFLSLTASLVWIFGFLFEAALQADPSSATVVIAAVAAGVAVSWIVFCSVPSFLMGDGVAPLGYYVAGTVIAYFVTVPLGAFMG